MASSHSESAGTYTSALLFQGPGDRHRGDDHLTAEGDVECGMCLNTVQWE